jgi:RNA polymerase sigma-70 factor (ECF subfamily)
MMQSMASDWHTARIEPADEALVNAAREGDRDAFSVLVARYRGLVFAYAYAQVRQREEAEDLAQEAFARAFVCLSRLRGPGAWQSWLMRILRNLCTDALRRRKVRQTEPLEPTWPDAGGTPETQVVSEERRRELEAAVAALPETLRVPLVMHVVSRCTYREIAIALGVPETTVVGRTARAVRALRRRLKELEL